MNAYQNTVNQFRQTLNAKDLAAKTGKWSTRVPRSKVEEVSSTELSMLRAGETYLNSLRMPERIIVLGLSANNPLALYALAVSNKPGELRW